ncbi:MAG: glutathione peroxidase [Bacilli bacterium]|jgi:glutathione peroxidase|nr:glutathione peroxidase [Bacilli bacterium]
MNVYDFTVEDQKGNAFQLNNYAGKVLLIVNTATHCGFTPTYKTIEELYEKHRAEGLEVLDFPCNQFGAQAPETVEEISDMCSLTYHTTFPRFQKIEVNGDNAIPLYKFLESQKGFAGFDPAHKLTKVLEDINAKENKDWKNDPSIKWNFTKFLIDRKGNVVKRYEPTASFDIIEHDVKALLEAK